MFNPIQKHADAEVGIGFDHLQVTPPTQGRHIVLQQAQWKAASEIRQPQLGLEPECYTRDYQQGNAAGSQRWSANVQEGPQEKPHYPVQHEDVPRG